MNETTTTTYTDPRGPIRTIVAVEKRSTATLVTLSCGHVRQANQSYSYPVGSEYRCLACLDAQGVK